MVKFSPALGKTESQVIETLASLLRETSQMARDVLSIKRLEGDASTRTYFRAESADGTSVMLMVFPEIGSGEDKKFLDMQAFLQSLDLPVPRIFSHHTELGVIVLEDLGDILLETEARDADGVRLQELYKSALDIVSALQLRTTELGSGCPAFTHIFDNKKLLGEMSFFVTHFVEGLCRNQPSRAAMALLNDFFDRICSKLADQPKVMIHRDYHSRNILLQGRRMVMIDFQDAGMGPAQYDPASLLRDSYFALPHGMTHDLLEYFHGTLPKSRKSSLSEFIDLFGVMSLQRNLKALGTFGYQTNVRKSRRYVSSISGTARYISDTIEQYQEYSHYKHLLLELIIEPALQFPIE
jgi:N-acetylmuramate 1-kinase